MMNLGLLLLRTRRAFEAAKVFSQVTTLFPQSPEAHNFLGDALTDSNQWEQAEAAYRAAIALDPNGYEPHTNLGSLLRLTGNLNESAAEQRKAIAIAPERYEAYINLANTLKDQGDFDEAIQNYRKGLAIHPDPIALSNLLYTMLFSHRVDPVQLLAEHRAFADLHAGPLASSIPHHANDPSPSRRLKIGYISPDFRDHAVGRFLLPLFAHHNHEQFHLTCFSDVAIPDAVTAQLRAHTDAWHDITALSHSDVAQLVHQNHIDILIDLTLHMAHNRMLVFARKPAPIQITYLAYALTSGLPTMAYRLTDSFLDPPGQNDNFYTEKSLYLPQSYWCYQPHPAAPEVNLLPAANTGQITFGCLNHFSKINEPTLLLWSKILRALPNSRMVLHAKAGSHQDRVAKLLDEQNVAPSRLEFVPPKDIADYFYTYHRIDIALDPFPYNGGTTTCDALWMGVPVVTLAGQLALARAGVSILTNSNLPELIAQSPDQYISIATTLARDLPRLAKLRSTMRDRLTKSPLMDAPTYTHGIESAYRQAWRNWCAQRQPSKF